MAGLLDLHARAPETEAGDDGALHDRALHAHCLAHRAEANRLTRAHRPVLQFLDRAWAALPRERPLSVLDIGCGQGDLLRAVWRLAWRHSRPVRLQGWDSHPYGAAAARVATPPAMDIRFVATERFDALPDDATQHDFIVSSQFVHRFDDQRLVAFLQWLQQHARLGWCITDVRRHWLPYVAFGGLAWLAGWHPRVRRDGQRSIARACTPDEWRALVQRSGLSGVVVQTQWPFRVAVHWLREPDAGAAPAARR